MGTMHDASPVTNNHIVQSLEYADEAAREAATGFADGDIGRVARQLDDNTFWMLTSIGPAGWTSWEGNTEGDVSGPNSSVDDALPIWDGETGKLLKDSGVLISDLSTFLGLTDTPSSYSGEFDKGLRVASGELALEFGPDVSTRRVQSTGLLSGGEIVNAMGNTTIDIDPGTGCISNYFDPVNPILTDLAFGGFTGELPGYTNTQWAVGADGLLQQFDETLVTNLDRRNYIMLGRTIIDGGGIVIQVSDHPGGVCYDGFDSVQDFIRDVIGPANINGNSISANGANLMLDNSGGTIYFIASNFRTNVQIPDETTVASSTAFTFLYGIRALDPSDDTIILGPFDEIDPNSWDDGTGTLAVMNNNNWSIQVVSIFTTGTIAVQYGQTQYNTQAEAEEAVINGTYAFEEKSPIGDSVLRCWLVVGEGKLDLSSATDATFFEAEKFRLSGSGSSSGNISGVNAPGGTDTMVQFNDLNTFGGDSGLIYIKSSQALAVGGTLEIKSLAFLDVDADDNFQFTNQDINPSPGTGNTAIGHGALHTINNVDTVDNVAIGLNSQYELLNGDGHNTAVGARTLQLNSSGIDNTSIGYDALKAVTTGSQNTALGANAGATLTTGSNNILIGNGVDVITAAGDDFINIGGFFTADTDTLEFSIGQVTAYWAGSNIFIGRYGVGTENLVLGVNAGIRMDSLQDGQNVLLGYRAAADATQIDGSIVIGYHAADEAETLSNVIVIGTSINPGDQTDYLNIGDFIIGDLVTRTATVGDMGLYYNVADTNLWIGSDLPETLINGAVDNVVIGNGMPIITDDNSNIAIGYDVLSNLAGSGGRNIGIGRQVLTAMTTGDKNIAIGVGAGQDNITGEQNHFIGYRAGINSLGNNAIMIGANVAELFTNGSDNVFIGTDLGAIKTGGARNTYVGTLAAPTQTSGDDCIIIGYNEDLPSGHNDRMNIGGILHGELEQQTLRIGGSYAAGFSNNNVALEFGGVSQGLRFPLVSTSQRNSMTGLEGLQVWNTDTLHMEYYDGGGWRRISNAAV